MKPLVDSTPLLGDADRLRSQAAADGYLLVRDLLPATLIEELADEDKLTVARARRVQRFLT